METMSYYIQTENTETFICDWQEGGGVKAFRRNLNPEIARYWNPGLKRTISSLPDSSTTEKQRWGLSIYKCCPEPLPKRWEQLVFTD